TIFQKLFLNHFPSGTRWFDKTPGVSMLNAVPFLIHLWPDARFIFCKRYGVNNVISQLRYFGTSVTFDTACATWSSCMQQWFRVRSLIPAENYIEIDQFELVRSPKVVARQIANICSFEQAQEGRISAALLTTFANATSNSFDLVSLSQAP